MEKISNENLEKISGGEANSEKSISGNVDLKKLKKYGARYIKKLALDNMLEAISTPNKN